MNLSSFTVSPTRNTQQTIQIFIKKTNRLFVKHARKNAAIKKYLLFLLSQ
jgi:hypothetical protein